jgi:AraC-like DNA-binding protein
MEKDNSKYCMYFWVGHFLYLGYVTDNSEHMHHALQVIVNRDGLFRLRIDESSIECGGVVISPDLPHQLLSSSDSQVHLFIDRESAVAEAIASRHLGEGQVKILGGALLKRLRGCIDVPGNFLGSCGQANEVYRRLVTELGGYAKHAEVTVDPRIKAAVQLIQEKYLTRKVYLAELARHACLSESHLMHMFTEQIGIPPRRYVLWRRLMTAFQFAIQGRSLTESADSAGFSDSAHLSRTFKRMYGITLSECTKNHKCIQVFSCLS